MLAKKNRLKTKAVIQVTSRMNWVVYFSRVIPINLSWPGKGAPLLRLFRLLPSTPDYFWRYTMKRLKPPDRHGQPPDCRWIFGQPPDPPPGIPRYGHPVSGLYLLNKSPTRMVSRKSKNFLRYSAIFTKQLAPLRSDLDPIDNHTTERLHQLTLPTNQFFIFDHN